MVKDDTRLRVREPEVAAKIIDGEAVIINLGTGMYYSMTGTGGFVWSLIESNCSMAEAADLLAKSYHVSQETALSDVRRLWEELVAEDLVAIADDRTGCRGEAKMAIPDDRIAYEAPALAKFQDMVDLFAADPPLPELPEVAVGTRDGA
jgi:Coenzyme PQQ synthesis protein D (PqqD)